MQTNSHIRTVLQGESTAMSERSERRRIRNQLSREHAQLRQLWYVCQAAPAKPEQFSSAAQARLRILDCQRRQHQRNIIDASAAAGKACAKCGGACCKVIDPDTSHYYSTDFWLRRFTDSPVPNQDRILVQHPLRVWPNAWIAFSRYVIRRLWYGKGHGSPPPLDIHPCMYLAENGCRLPPEDRPITCLAFTCKEYQAALDVAVLESIARDIRGLRRLSAETYDILRQERRLGRRTGWFRLALASLPVRQPIHGLRHKGRIL